MIVNSFAPESSWAEAAEHGWKKYEESRAYKPQPPVITAETAAEEGLPIARPVDKGSLKGMAQDLGPGQYTYSERLTLRRSNTCPRFLKCPRFPKSELQQDDVNEWVKSFSQGGVGGGSTPSRGGSRAGARELIQEPVPYPERTRHLRYVQDRQRIKRPTYGSVIPWSTELEEDNPWIEGHPLQDPMALQVLRSSSTERLRRRLSPEPGEHGGVLRTGPPPRLVLQKAAMATFADSQDLQLHGTSASPPGSPKTGSKGKPGKKKKKKSKE
eukprot:TRINITY_DN27803_c0_g1_i1.p1 TRINITY_DN27803_c0_g1~~TRINITY_DN27803_c0_g1_i1.p1  ORF type:complete len:270 (-),score=45.14 TRINITY_DN27803_c0_g1_i1:86-895(-)